MSAAVQTSSDVYILEVGSCSFSHLLEYLVFFLVFFCVCLLIQVYCVLPLLGFQVVCECMLYFL